METSKHNELPSIPNKRYFTIGEVSQLCGVKAHVLRYWESEFPQLKPMKRGGNRRYYQRHEVLLIRKIRELVHEQGFTIAGAKNQLGTQTEKNTVETIPELEPQEILFDTNSIRRELTEIIALINSK